MSDSDSDDAVQRSTKLQQDAEDSESSDPGNESEDDDFLPRHQKKQTQHAPPSEPVSERDSESVSHAEKSTVTERADEQYESNDDEGNTSGERTTKRSKTRTKKKKTLADAETKGRGVVYINRPPPYMRPDKVRHLLEQYAPITRVFLQPEDETLRRKRRKQGGNRKVRYSEGWIEFERKKDAKKVVALLNGTMLGGKKRFYREDVWTLKYLSKFKWSHLTEKMRYERIVREKKLTASLSQAKRESEFVRKKVGQARRMEYAKAKGDDGDAGKKFKTKTMRFKQRPVADKGLKRKQPDADSGHNGDKKVAKASSEI